MVSWVDVLRAQTFAMICWYKNNRFLLLEEVLWPYMMTGMVFGMGLVFGTVEEYAMRVGIGNPALFVLTSSVVAMSSFSITFRVIGFVLWNRWIGTLPYIFLSPAKTPAIMIASGLPDSVISPLIISAAILPAAIYLEGSMGALGLAAILALIFIGMLPMVGMSVLMASAMLLTKREDFFHSIMPLILLASGVYYPLEVLPAVLQALSKAIPTTYVVDAAKLVAAYLLPEVRLLMASLYALAALALIYNITAGFAVRRVEGAVKRKGVLY